MIRLYFGMVAT